MANYKEIHGQKVQAVSSDPANPIAGQVWYNTTTNLLKYKAPIGAGSWATGGNLNSGRRSGASFGTQSASLYVGGRFAPGPGRTAFVESYNGSSWSEVADIPAIKDRLRGAGTTSAGLVFGGEPETADTQTWNGSSWTEVNNLNTARHDHMSGGVQSSALAFGGEVAPSNTTIGNTESWNGTSWSEVADLNTAREQGGGCGTSNTESICFGGGTAPSVPTGFTNTETWNGSSWTETADLNVIKVYGGGFGATPSAVACGSYSPSPSVWADVEEWNGSSWAEVNNLANGRYFTNGGSGTGSLGLLAGGQAGPGTPNMNNTEEWTKSPGVETISTT